MPPGYVVCSRSCFSWYAAQTLHVLSWCDEARKVFTVAIRMAPYWGVPGIPGRMPCRHVPTAPRDPTVTACAACTSFLLAAPSVGAVREACYGGLTMPPLPYGPQPTRWCRTGAAGPSPSPLGDLYAKRRQNLRQPAGFALRACLSRGCRAHEAREGAAPLRRQVTGDAPPWWAGRGIPGPQAAATTVADATNVTPSQPWADKSRSKSLPPWRGKARMGGEERGDQPPPEPSPVKGEGRYGVHQLAPYLPLSASHGG